MAHISIYPYEARRAGNEAVLVEASETAGQFLDPDSDLGAAFYRAAETLGILTESLRGAAILEGQNKTIDEQRELFEQRIPEIVMRALSIAPHKVDEESLTRIVSEFGTPLAPPAQGSFNNRMVTAAKNFGNLSNVSSDDLRVYKHQKPRQPRG